MSTRYIIIFVQKCNEVEFVELTVDNFFVSLTKSSAVAM